MSENDIKRLEQRADKTEETLRTLTTDVASIAQSVKTLAEQFAVERSQNSAAIQDVLAQIRGSRMTPGQMFAVVSSGIAVIGLLVGALSLPWISAIRTNTDEARKLQTQTIPTLASRQEIVNIRAEVNRQIQYINEKIAEQRSDPFTGDMGTQLESRLTRRIERLEQNEGK